MGRKTPFASAILNKDVRCAVSLLRADPKVIHQKIPSSYDYEWAIHAAVRLDSVELAQLAVDNGMPVDKLDGGGYTALFLAPELGASLAIVKFLVENGADIHVDNDNPLWSAIWQVSYGFGGMPIVRYLIKKGSKPRGLTHAAEAGKLRIVRLLTEFGADVNERDEHSHTPLDYASGLAHTFMKSHVEKKKSKDFEGVKKYLRSKGAKLSSELDAANA